MTKNRKAALARIREPKFYEISYLDTEKAELGLDYYEKAEAASLLLPDAYFRQELFPTDLLRVARLLEIEPDSVDYFKALSDKQKVSVALETRYDANIRIAYEYMRLVNKSNMLIPGKLLTLNPGDYESYSRVHKHFQKNSKTSSLFYTDIQQLMTYSVNFEECARTLYSSHDNNNNMDYSTLLYRSTLLLRATYGEEPFLEVMSNFRYVVETTPEFRQLVRLIEGWDEYKEIPFDWIIEAV